MVLRERPLAVRYPGVDTFPVSLSALQAIDTIVERFENHHAYESQEKLDHVMATIIRNRTISDNPTSADDTVSFTAVCESFSPRSINDVLLKKIDFTRRTVSPRCLKMLPAQKCFIGMIRV